MKRTMLTAMVILLIQGVNVSAETAGNPSDLKLTEVEDPRTGVTFESTAVFDRDLEKGAQLDEAQNFFTRFFYKPEEFPVELYVLAGVMRFEVDQGVRYFETDYGFAFGFGARSDIWSNGEGTAVGLDLKYRRSEPDIDESTFGSRQDATYQDWEVALRASRELNENLKPYAGVKYDDARISGVPGFASQNSEHVVGLFGGADISLTDELTFNVETSIISEYALTGGIEWKF